MDALRISARDHKAIISDLDQRAESFRGADLRAEERIPFLDAADVTLQLDQPAGPKLRYQVKVRNISRGGIGILHGAYVHIDTLCTIELTTVYGTRARISGAVVRCRHLRRNVHEVGVKFDHPIDLSDFLADYKSSDDLPSDDAETCALSGKILYIDNSVDDRRLMQFLVENLGLMLETASNGLEGLNLCRQTLYDVIIINLWLPEMTGTQIAQILRANSYPGPIIAVTADEREDTKTEALAKGCSWVLVKPYDFDDLMVLLSRFLRIERALGSGPEPLISSKWYYVKMRPLILEYLDRLERHVHRLERFVNAQDGRAILRHCLEIKGSAGGYGYSSISRAAGHLRDAAVGGLSGEEIRAKFDELVKLCKAACLVQRRMESKPSR
ncbi:MAG: response regulator [Planctomycetes bacterium]|nr:response regulator [Planctomycetota bacterium]